MLRIIFYRYFIVSKIFKILTKILVRKNPSKNPPRNFLLAQTVPQNFLPVKVLIKMANEKSEGRATAGSVPWSAFAEQNSPLYISTAAPHRTVPSAGLK